VKANKGFLQLRRLEAARDIATLLAASGNRVMLDSATLLLNGELLSDTLALSPIDAICSNRNPERFVKFEEVNCGLLEWSFSSWLDAASPLNIQAPLGLIRSILDSLEMRDVRRLHFAHQALPAVIMRHEFSWLSVK